MAPSRLGDYAITTMVKGYALILLGVALLIASVYQGFVVQHVESRGGRVFGKITTLEGDEAIVLGGLGVLIAITSCAIGVLTIRNDRSNR